MPFRQPIPLFLLGSARTTRFRRAYRTVCRRNQVTLQSDTPTAPRLDVRDDRDAPLFDEAGCREITMISEKKKEIF
jgi:hypothetical protein